MTFEEKTAEINVLGWTVNNCFQVNNHTRWRVNIRHDGRDAFSAFGDGDSPIDALIRATKTVDMDVPAAEEADDLEALLG